MSKDTQNKLISASVTAGVMALLFVFMLFCGFTHQVPPPPAKKVILIELEEEEVGGGGGGGGTPQQAPTPQPTPATTSAVTTNDASAPATNYTKTPTPQQTTTAPKVNQKAMFSGVGGGTGSGNGTGTGSGSGSGRGTGIGTGDGAGNGGGIGYGTGNRGYRRAPDITIPITESGIVFVEALVDEMGKVVSTKICADGIHQTTIVKSDIREACCRAVASTQYVPGKKERRIICFSPGGVKDVY